MVNLDQKYKWLNDIKVPNTIKNALDLYGTKEKIGAGSNPVILDWAAECNIPYNADDIPWCGLFAAVVCKRSNWEFVKSPLWARNWAKFGQPADKPSLGDVLVFVRDGGGHVGFYVAEDSECYHVLGGNQSDSVNIIRIKKSRMIAARRPVWKVKQPDSVKPYIVDATGVISTNES